MPTFETACKEMKFLPSTFSASEALSLILAASIAVERINIPFGEALRCALRKIEAVLPEQINSMVGKMQKRVSVGVNLVRECNAETINTLSQSISNHNPVEITYMVASRNEMTERKVDPYGLTFRFGTWYLIAYCHLRQHIRTFGVDRIRSLHVLKDHFKYPENFDLEKYLGRAWSLQADANQLDVKLRFSPKITPWIVGCKFHPHQKVTAQRDGSALFKVTVAGMDEIKHWILSFGDEVEVLEPASLRALVAATSSRMADLYDGKTASSYADRRIGTGYMTVNESGVDYAED
jgi:predicted DNA-binding transcriptional regulator YafY